MENWLLIHFLSILPGPLSFYTALENNTIFLQQFFRFRGGSFPLPPLRAPMDPEELLERGWKFLKISILEQTHPKASHLNPPQKGR